MLDSDVYYHYTNLSAFKNIIESGELWFTRVDSLNDYSEYNYYKNILMSAREEYIKTKKTIKEKDKYLIYDIVDKHFITTRDSYYKKTFAFSLTKKPDSIPMWNYYSDKLGIAIGFNMKLFDRVIVKQLDKSYYTGTYTIEYNKRKQIKSIKSKIDEILKLANSPEFDGEETHDSLLDKVDDILADMWYDSFMYKDESFEYENEVRLLLCNLNDKENNKDLKKLNFIVTEHNIKPVLKIKLVDNWDKLITRIICSPFNPSEKIIENIYDFLTENNVRIDENKITKSVCPVRNF